MVFVPGIVPERDERFRIGDVITFRKPDGSSSAVAIGGIEMISCETCVARREVIVLLKELIKEDVPVGTEVWSVDA